MVNSKHALTDKYSVPQFSEEQKLIIMTGTTIIDYMSHTIHQVIFWPISSVQNVASHFRKLQKKTLLNSAVEMKILLQ